MNKGELIMNNLMQQGCPVLFGCGAVDQVGIEAKKLKITKALCVYDEAMKSTGAADRVIGYLKEAGIETVSFDKVLPDPPEEICDEGAELGRKEKVDGVIAIGGGSTIDTAKAIDILLTNPGKIDDYFGNPFPSLAPNPILPLISIPTTSGTGSEVTFAGVITSNKAGGKRSVLATGHFAILDPEMTVTAPPGVTAGTGMDAFCHAAENITNIRDNPKSTVLASHAVKLLLKWLPVAVKDGKNLEARTQVALASNFAGMAINEGWTSYGHCMAHAMAATVVEASHGILCALAFPVYIKIRAEECPEKVRVLAEALGLDLDENVSPSELGEAIAQRVIEFNREIGVKSLKEMGVKREDLVGHLKHGEAVLNDFNYERYHRNPKPAEFWTDKIVEAYDIYQ